MRNIDKIIRMRLISPNNATTQLMKHLSNIGFSVNTGRRKSVNIDNKKYIVTITGAKEDRIDCRQFNSDGVISFYEKNGQIYKIDRDDLIITSKTREFNTNKFEHAISKQKIVNLTPMGKIKQVNISKYQESYITIAEEVSNAIVERAISKMIG